MQMKRLIVEFVVFVVLAFGHLWLDWRLDAGKDMTRPGSNASSMQSSNILENNKRMTSNDCVGGETTSLRSE